MIDFKGNGKAVLNRRRKATALAAWCMANGYDPAVIVDPKQRREIERSAEVRRCSDETWAEAVSVYDLNRPLVSAPRRAVHRPA